MPTRRGRPESMGEVAGPHRFATIEGSDAYVELLLQAVEETATDVNEELRETRCSGGRRREAFRLVAYKLEQLRFHLERSRRRLGDLRALRSIVDGEDWEAAA
jgi:hypothetical protein